MNVLQSNSESEIYIRKKAIYARSLSYVSCLTFNSLGICVNTVRRGKLDRKLCTDAMSSIPIPCVYLVIGSTLWVCLLFVTQSTFCIPGLMSGGTQDTSKDVEGLEVSNQKPFNWGHACLLATIPNIASRQSCKQTFCSYYLFWTVLLPLPGRLCDSQHLYLGITAK